MKIQTRCAKDKLSEDYATSAKGYLLQCCWCDQLTTEHAGALMK